MRVIFDRSAFHGNNFDLLRNSALRKLVASNRVRVLITHDFLDETIATVGSKRASGNWREHHNFALDLCDGRVFLPHDEIWQSELVAGRGRRARYLRRLRPALIAAVRRAVYSDKAMSEVVRRAAPIVKENQLRKDHWKRMCLMARDSLAQWAKEHRITGEARRDFPFSELSEIGLREIGGMLMPLVDRDRAGRLSDVWARSPEGFPFYTAFVEGVLYTMYYAMSEPNLRIDRNSIADASQLAYLVWADVVVSNDNRFFRSAFKTLWEPHGKRMESTEGFVELLEAKFVRRVAPGG